MYVHGEFGQMPQIRNVRFPNTSVIASPELPDMGAVN